MKRARRRRRRFEKFPRGRERGEGVGKKKIALGASGWLKVRASPGRSAGPGEGAGRAKGAEVDPATPDPAARPAGREELGNAGTEIMRIFRAVFVLIAHFLGI